MLASIVIRTLNEERHLPQLLQAIESQEADLDWDVVVVDSGSSDSSVAIAESFGCRVVRIARSEFSFGRSLNLGCDASRGELLVFVSGHCVPVERDWLARLVAPLLDGRVAYAYGRQVGGPGSRFSERQLFRRQYPETSALPQSGIFCNNANAALLRDVWAKYRFDEDSTGLEDMQLARALERDGLPIGYVAEAAVAHHHDETWRQVRWRFEREAIALRHILPEIQISLLDFARYLASALLLDWKAALQEGELARRAVEIARFRLAQYWGSYRGNHEHRRLSRERKEHYFYPADPRRHASGS